MDKYTLKFNMPHTLVILCGPTKCGKSTFAKKASEALSNCDGYKYSSVIVSSDDIRRELLNDPFAHAHDAKMYHVSKQAFSLLTSKVEAHMSYPVNTEFIFVDTRGMASEFRQQMIDLAFAHNYKTMLVTFDYSNSEYLKGVSEEEEWVVRRDVNRYKRKCLPSLRRKQYSSSIRIPNKSVLEAFFEVEVTFNDDKSLPDKYKACWVREPDCKYAVIGDVHEQVDTLKRMCEELWQIQQDIHIVLVGDWIDKGKSCKGVIEFLHPLVMKDKRITLILGNHENYVYKRLNNLIEKPVAKEFEQTMFSSLATLTEDSALRSMFEDLVESSLPFLKVDHKKSSFIVTHAPCETKYLGKVDSNSLRCQRHFPLENRAGNTLEELDFLIKSDKNYPIHIFGHIPHCSSSLVFRNNIFLDTGACYGNLLSAVLWDEYGFDIFKIPSAESSNLHGEFSTVELPAFLDVQEEFDINKYDLTPQDFRLLKNIEANNIRYISGTMTPAPSKDNELEGIEAALEYFYKRGVFKLWIQPKYMGSRAQLYLSREDFDNPDGALESSFFASRKGWKIDHIPELTKAALRDFLKNNGVFRLNYKSLNWSTMILDGELLPWHVLGRGLIENDFEPYKAVVKESLDMLDNDPVVVGLGLFREGEIAQRKEMLEVFNQTLELYAKEENPYFKSFAILSIDGRSACNKTLYDFSAVNADSILYVDMSDGGDYLQRAEEFFERKTVIEQMEGVVIKPVCSSDALKAVPYMKVRNKRYLTLIYGYDYMLRYDQFCKTKNISAKAALSRKEYELGMKMLEATPADIQEYAVKMIGTMRSEATLDPRL